VNCITVCAATSQGTMDKQPQRIPTWLSIDLAILAVSVIIWIGFEGPPRPLLSLIGQP
jgi:hypothetical protein